MTINRDICGQLAAANSHCLFSFDRAMTFEQHHSKRKPGCQWLWLSSLGAKRMRALAAGLVFVSVLSLGRAQMPITNGITAPGTLYLTSHSNLVSILNAVKVASGLRVGMAGADAWKYVQDHGMVQTNVYSVSLDRGRTMACPYPLEGGATLMLDMHCTKGPTRGLFGWSDPVFDRAYIQSQGVEIIAITPTNSPQPDGAANGSQPIRSETNRTSSAAGFRR
jgi:hypothetical protein